MLRERVYAVYILASKLHGTLYIGVTGDLITRIAQHKCGETPGFTSKYKVHSLVYFEYFGEIQTAIQREKAMKKWPRQWKINLIERTIGIGRICTRNWWASPPRPHIL